MAQKFILKLHIRLPVGQTALVFGMSWLLIVPAGLWAIATIYIPILGASFDSVQTWSTSVLIALLVFISLVLHSFAHLIANRSLGGRPPQRIPQYILADAAQVWPAGRSAGNEALIALAGPLASMLLAGLSFLLWDAQINPSLNVSAPFVAVFNAFVAIINLTPGYPFDGGRVLRAILWGIVGKPENSARSGKFIGLLIVALLVVWGMLLFLQRARFSLQTGAVSLLVASLIWWELYAQPVWKWDLPMLEPKSELRTTLRTGLSGLLVLIMLVFPLSLVPTNAGLEAPGVALPVEPMIEVPPQFAYRSEGSFILTTVIPQAPILAGEWVYAKLTPVVRLVPAEQIVPANTTPQEIARQGTEMLNESEQTAIAVGLRLAGYEVSILGEGVRVVTIEAGSPSKDLLLPGDIITSLNGEPTLTVPDLTDRIQAQSPGSQVELHILRNTHQIAIKVPLMAPVEPGAPPRIGITVESVGFQTRLPFPVKIQPQKIVGGPSAGLMFTLTVYNQVTEQDLTSGRKIAGTGTISLEGEVGPIGGVEQKVAAAENAGAAYFLSPPENYADAKSVARQIEVVRVATAQQAIEFLKSLPKE